MQNNLVSHRILDPIDLSSIQPGENGEPLSDVTAYDSDIIARYNKIDMYAYTKDAILVRDTLAKKLAAINKKLVNNYNLRLKIVYGYRHPEVQRHYFEARKAAIKEQNPDMDDDALDQMTHYFVAIPEIAGHPTGGAIDITITDKNGEDLAMGTKIADYTDPEKIKTFAQGLTSEEEENRKLLHDLMVEEGFAPFYGEWWHFSLGDREWAAFYNKKIALYSAFDYMNQ